MLFREHRGTLLESLKTNISIEPTKEALLVVLKDRFMGEIEAKDITMNFYGFDKRLDEDVYSVHINNNIVGFTNEMIAGINARDFK